MNHFAAIQKKLEEYELGEYMLGVKKMSAEEVAKVVHD